jgi:hypothetical protein
MAIRIGMWRRERQMPRYGFSGTDKLHKVAFGGEHHSKCGLAYLEKAFSELPLPPNLYDRCSKCFNIPKEETKPEKKINSDISDWCLRIGFSI